MKVMWYLPIIPRMKRLFANPNHAKNLRWHVDERKCDGMYLLNQVCSSFEESKSFVFDERLKVFVVAEVL